jgi:hypothetical protein
MLQKVRTATIVQEKALAAKYRRETAAAESNPSTAWGQSNRLEAMKDRLLALEREKIARMDPARLEVCIFTLYQYYFYFSSLFLPFSFCVDVQLMNLLADMGHNLDEDTVTALLRWKQQA